MVGGDPRVDVKTWNGTGFGTDATGDASAAAGSTNEEKSLDGNDIALISLAAVTGLIGLGALAYKNRNRISGLWRHEAPAPASYAPPHANLDSTVRYRPGFDFSDVVDYLKKQYPGLAAKERKVFYPLLDQILRREHDSKGDNLPRNKDGFFDMKDPRVRAFLDMNIEKAASKLAGWELMPRDPMEIISWVTPKELMDRPDFKAACERRLKTMPQPDVLPGQAILAGWMEYARSVSNAAARDIGAAKGDGSVKTDQPSGPAKPEAPAERSIAPATSTKGELLNNAELDSIVESALKQTIEQLVNVRMGDPKMRSSGFGIVELWFTGTERFTNPTVAQGRAAFLAIVKGWVINHYFKSNEYKSGQPLTDALTRKLINKTFRDGALSEMKRIACDLTYETKNEETRDMIRRWLGTEVADYVDARAAEETIGQAGNILAPKTASMKELLSNKELDAIVESELKKEPWFASIKETLEHPLTAKLWADRIALYKGVVAHLYKKNPEGPLTEAMARRLYATAAAEIEGVESQKINTFIPGIRRDEYIRARYGNEVADYLAGKGEWAGVRASSGARKVAAAAPAPVDPKLAVLRATIPDIAENSLLNRRIFSDPSERDAYSIHKILVEIAPEMDDVSACYKLDVMWLPSRIEHVQKYFWERGWSVDGPEEMVRTRVKDALRATSTWTSGHMRGLYTEALLSGVLSEISREPDGAGLRARVPKLYKKLDAAMDISVDKLFENPEAFADEIIRVVKENPNDPALDGVRARLLLPDGEVNSFARDGLIAKIENNRISLLDAFITEVELEERGSGSKLSADLLATRALKHVAERAMKSTKSAEAPKDVAKGEERRDEDVRDSEKRRDDIMRRLVEGLRERGIGREVR